MLRDDCPNCRGPGHLSAVWTYLGQREITQFLDEQRNIQAPNMLGEPSLLFGGQGIAAGSSDPVITPTFLDGPSGSGLHPIPVAIPGAPIVIPPSELAGFPTPAGAPISLTPRSVVTTREFPTPDGFRAAASSGQNSLGHSLVGSRAASRERSVLGSRPPSRENSSSHSDGNTTPSFRNSQASYVTMPTSRTGLIDWLIPSEHDTWANNLKTNNPQSPDGVDQTEDGNLCFHTETRLRSGEPGILIDPGSVGNLAGSEWIREVTKWAFLNHRRDKVKQYKRDRPLNVCGVGNGSQECPWNGVVPVATARTDNTYSRGTFEAPIVPNSMLPGLIGIESLQRRRGIIDLVNFQVHLCGPGDLDLSKALPPGSESFPCVRAPSGHMLLPCCKYAEVDKDQSGKLDLGPEMALLTHTQ